MAGLTTEQRTLAFLAVVLGAVLMLALLVSHPSLNRPNTLQEAPEVLGSLRAAILAYAVEHNALPAMVPLSQFADDRQRLVKAAGASLTTVEPGKGGYLFGLTTPIGYLLELPQDPFSGAMRVEVPPAYWTDGRGFIVISAGPDADYDIDPVRDFDSATTDGGVRLRVHRYNPEAGLFSNGDIFQVLGMEWSERLGLVSPPGELEQVLAD